MDICKVKPEKLMPARYNPRMDLQPKDEEYKSLQKSIDTFGYIEPIIWNEQTGHVVGGHQRLKILLAKGYSEIEVSRLNVYEWGCEKLKEAFSQIGFEIVQEVGLVMGVKDMDKFYEKQPAPVRGLYQKIKAYLPSPWLTVILSIPFPEVSKEVLFIVRKKGEK